MKPTQLYIISTCRQQDMCILVSFKTTFVLFRMTNENGYVNFSGTILPQAVHHRLNEKALRGDSNTARWL